MGRPKNEIDETALNAVKRLKETRDATGMNQKEFAEKFGVHPATYCRYESGDIARMPLSLIEKICDEYSLSKDWLIGFPDANKYIIIEKFLEPTKKIPIWGNIVSGIPLTAQKDLHGYETIAVSDKTDFCMIVHGDSMIGARIYDGDLAYVKSQAKLETGEIGVVIINDNNAELKRFYQVGNTILLKSENPQYQDIAFTKNDFKNVKILGKVVSVKFDAR